MKRYLTIKEAAKILKVHPDTLRRWDRAGKLKTRRHKENNYRLYTGIEIAKILKVIKGKL